MKVIARAATNAFTHNSLGNLAQIICSHVLCEQQLKCTGLDGVAKINYSSNSLFKQAKQVLSACYV